MQLLAIGHVARQAGVPTSTIRYYERIGLLPPCQRHNGRRRYDASIFQQLSIIRLAQQAGFSIAEIQTLLHDFPADAPPVQRWRALSRQKMVQIDQQMEQLQATKALLARTLDCRCASLDDCAAGDVQTSCEG